MNTKEELRQSILKEALVRSAVQRWEKVPGEPVKTSHQEIVEIGINDLMKLISEFESALLSRVREIIGEDDEFPHSKGESEEFIRHQFMRDYRRNELRSELRYKLDQLSKEISDV